MTKAPPGYVYAILAALLFGASTPAAKGLLVGASPWLLAGLLYLGSGVGLLIVRACSRALGIPRKDAVIRGRDWIWLASATTFGGVLGPLLLMTGLARTDAASASLMLNLEGVFTGFLAWFVFHESFDRRILGPVKK